MTRLWLVFLLGCAAARPAQTPAEPRAPITVTPAPAQAPDLDEAAVKARTKTWFEAIDRYDSAGFSEPLSATFVLFSQARFATADDFSKALKVRSELRLPSTTRTWRDERVFIAGNTATFIGRALETRPEHEDNPPSERDAFHTVVWTREGARWLVAHWTWQRWNTDDERDAWNEVYAQATHFNRNANQLLVDTIKGRKPGTALDVATGQGRNALHLAAQRWRTTGIDISDEGLRQTREGAAQQKVKVTTVEADFEKYDFGTNKWDLVTLIYAGDDAKLVERIKPSLKKGGLFICEYFHSDSEIAKSGAGGWDTGELAGLFSDGFTIVRDEVVEDVADWSLRKTKLVRFVAQKK